MKQRLNRTLSIAAVLLILSIIGTRQPIEGIAYLFGMYIGCFLIACPVEFAVSYFIGE